MPKIDNPSDLLSTECFLVGQNIPDIILTWVQPPLDNGIATTVVSQDRGNYNKLIRQLHLHGGIYSQEREKYRKNYTLPTLAIIPFAT